MCKYMECVKSFLYMYKGIWHIDIVYEISSTLSALSFPRKDLEDEGNWTFVVHPKIKFQAVEKLFSFLSCISPFIFYLITGLGSMIYLLYRQNLCVDFAWKIHDFSTSFLRGGYYGLLGMWSSQSAIPLIPFGDDPQFLSMESCQCKWKHLENHLQMQFQESLITYASHSLYFQGENRIYSACVFLIDSNVT